MCRKALRQLITYYTDQSATLAVLQQSRRAEARLNGSWMATNNNLTGIHSIAINRALPFILTITILVYSRVIVITSSDFYHMFYLVLLVVYIIIL